MILGMPDEQARAWLRGLIMQLDRWLARNKPRHPQRAPLVVVPRRTVKVVDDAGEFWYERALCARSDVDPEIFHAPEEDDYPTYQEYYAEARRRIDEARRVCSSCPVTRECYEARANDRYGIWGGLTPHDRAQGRSVA